MFDWPVLGERQAQIRECVGRLAEVRITCTCAEFDAIEGATLALSPSHSHSSLTLSLALSHTLSLFISLSLTHTRTRSLSHALTLSLSHRVRRDRVCDGCSLSHTYTFTLSQYHSSSLTHSLSLLLSLSHTHTYSLSHSLTLSPSHTHTEFDAIVCATGATAARDMRIPGRDLNGIILAMEFLHTNTKSTLNPPRL